MDPLPLHAIHGDPDYLAFFTEALRVLCGEAPPHDLVFKWATDDESHAYNDADTLQDWAAQHAPRLWMMGITVIDAAEALAAEIRPRSEWQRDPY